MLHGVMDPQPGSFGFALFDGDRELVKTSCPMHGRDAAELPEFVEAQLAQINLKLSDVKRWTVGSGPGSFTFLRVVAALAAGWKFADPEMDFRCVPGALALAGATGETACGVLYDGRNKEILYFGAVKRNGAWESSGETAVLNAIQAQEFFASRPDEKLVCFECEKSAIEAILPDSVNVEAVSPCPAALAANTAIPFDNNLDDLVYIRPAVFS